MQDKTINNALLALAKQAGTQGKLAEVLLDMRGVEWSGIVQDTPFKRGGTQLIVLQALRQRPMTCWQLSDVIRQDRPDIAPYAGYNRAYQALRRLKDQGHVVQDLGPDGCLWRVSLAK